MRRPWGLALGLVLACASAALAQASPATPAGTASASATRHPEEGRPFVRRYAPAEVGGNTQVWAIVQDPRGVIYAGTNSGILEFDGATWRRIKVGLSQTVRAMALDRSGRIYVGAEGGAIGYLAPDGRRRLAVRVALGPAARSGAGIQRLPGVRDRGRGVLPGRGGPLPLGAREDDHHQTGVALQPCFADRRAHLLDRARKRAERPRGRSLPRASRYRAPRPRALPRPSPLRRSPSARRDQDRRSLPLRRRHPHSLPYAHRRLLQGLPALPGHDPGRRHLRPHHDLRRPGHHRPPGPARDPGEPRERACFGRRVLRDAGPGGGLVAGARHRPRPGRGSLSRLVLRCGRRATRSPSGHHPPRRAPVSRGTDGGELPGSPESRSDHAALQAARNAPFPVLAVHDHAGLHRRAAARS